jgi:galactose-1-phosphate uridylyltransferase
MFKKVVREAKFKNHLKGFELDIQQIEYRKDPLLNRWCRINVLRAQRRKESIACPDISELIESSAKQCYFCPERIQTQTPMFIEEIAPEGRISVGESIVFPNLSPFAQYHAVATITQRHYLKLEEFTEKQIQDTILASLEYIKRVNKLDRKAKFPTLNWNYLPPSGASIVHPHVQITVDAWPTCLVDSMLKASERYYRKHKENFWHRLLTIEQELNERFIANIGGTAWLASFVPLGNNEVSIIFKDISSIVELTPELIQDFASGLKKALYAYSCQCLGVESFNLSFYSTPINGSKAYCLNAKLISRPRLNYYYTNDAGFMERLHSEVVVESSPEVIAKEMKQFF